MYSIPLTFESAPNNIVGAVIGEMLLAEDIVADYIWLNMEPHLRKAMRKKKKRGRTFAGTHLVSMDIATMLKTSIQAPESIQFKFAPSVAGMNDQRCTLFLQLEGGEIWFVMAHIRLDSDGDSS